VSRPPVACTLWTAPIRRPMRTLRLSVFLVPGAATTAAATAAATVQSCGDHSYASRLCECAYNYAWSASEQGPSRWDISLRHNSYNRKPGNFMAAAYSLVDFKIALRSKAIYSKIASMQCEFNVVSVRFLYRCNVLLVFFAGEETFFYRHNRRRLDTIR